MADRGNIGFYMKSSRSFGEAWHQWGLTQHPTNNTISVTSAYPGSIAIISRNGIPLQRATADPSTGVINFYQFDDSGSQVYGITTHLQGTGPTGEAWSATVAGSTVTTTKIAFGLPASPSVNSA